MLTPVLPVQVQALVEAVAIRDDIAAQLRGTEPLVPYAVLFCRRDAAGHRLAIPERRVIRADPSRITPANRDGGLVDGLRKRLDALDPEALILVMFGYEPPALEPRLVAIQLETMQQPRQTWLAPLSHSEVGLSPGAFEAAAPPRHLSALLAKRESLHPPAMPHIAGPSFRPLPN